MRLLLINEEVKLIVVELSGEGGVHGSNIEGKAGGTLSVAVAVDTWCCSLLWKKLYYTCGTVCSQIN